ncbi:MAG: CrcB family protein [Pseudomonadota bacterium]|nr:CrcB family protein [Pseudomonadota bacterium]
MNISLSSFLFVGVGGALGAMARFGLNLLSNNFLGMNIVGTFLANILGCLFVGAFIEFIYQLSLNSLDGTTFEQHRLLFAVGFCGSFTTLSALIFEINELLHNNQLMYSFVYLICTLLGGFLFYWLGSTLIKYITFNI